MNKLVIIMLVASVLISTNFRVTRNTFTLSMDPILNLIHGGVFIRYSTLVVMTKCLFRVTLITLFLGFIELYDSRIIIIKTSYLRNTFPLSMNPILNLIHGGSIFYINSYGIIELYVSRIIIIKTS
ncbi:hypothetical protein ACJX0J_007527 [Zea mays]